MKPYVEPTADYFEENKLIQDEKHSIQLTSSALGSERPGFVLKMIKTDSDEKLSESELSNVSALEKDLSEKVFMDPNFHIVLCNENFVEIEE